MASKRPVIFIDRDGVINVDPIGDYIKSWKDFRFEEGAIEALKTLTDKDYDIIIISNQAGIGDGVYPESALWDIHAHMMEEFEKNKIRVADSFFCLHGKQAGCKCRKPEIGLFLRAADAHAFERSRTYFIGDKATDIEAGKRFGLRTIHVLTGHGKADLAELKAKNLVPDHTAKNLKDALRFVA